jgi:hypothetical protein
VSDIPGRASRPRPAPASDRFGAARRRSRDTRVRRPPCPSGLRRRTSPRTARACPAPHGSGRNGMRPCDPKRRMAPGRPSVISVTLPWHIVIPLAGLDWSSNTRSNASSVRMIRPIPRSGESGGSSGCRARRTPASSATGTTRSRNQPRVSQSRSSSTGAPGASGPVGPRGQIEPGHGRTPRPRISVEVRDHGTTAIQL